MKGKSMVPALVGFSALAIPAVRSPREALADEVDRVWIDEADEVDWVQIGKIMAAKDKRERRAAKRVRDGLRAELGAELIDHMRHALGLNQHAANGVPYRNRFWTSPNSPDHADWLRAVWLGLAWRSEPNAGYNGMVMFAVTDRGLDVLGVTDLSGLEACERFS